MAKKKYYVVWKGRKIGIFDSWKDCKEQIDNYKGAQYKSFLSLEAAKKAIKGNYYDYSGKNNKIIKPSKEEIILFGEPINPSISVDAAHSSKTKIMEYQGVATKTKRKLFNFQFKTGTNNIGEFLALVHGLSFLKQKNSNLPIYSDSKIAMNWVKLKQCKTNLPINNENKPLFDIIKRAEKWLKENSYSNEILKWETKIWGEIPADFGRK